MAEKPWDGRFSQGTDKLVEKFTSSIDVDKRLYEYDIDGSIAHCRMLSRSSVISEAEASVLSNGLAMIKDEIKNKKFVFDDSLEDIHMHVEDRLTAMEPKAAQKLHTARSRNDQVALDVRMYLREEVYEILSKLSLLKKVVTGIAREHLGVIMPGYTHLQRAQPVLFSHHMLAYYEMFKRDSERLTDCLKRINVLVLGSAALAGTTYPIDRFYTANLLDFDSVSENSMDSVSDRDFVMEFISAASICMVHFSRFSEELVLWSSSEFDFIVLPDAFATGSSIMPQKKNPDVPEIVRGKTGRVFGNLIAVLTLMKALPLAYNRDMQEDKEPLFDTVDTLKFCIDIYTKMLPEISINKKNMRNAASKGFLDATDFADYLVTQGMAFREAHNCAGKAVAYAIVKDKELSELSLAELKNFSSLVKKDVFDFLVLERMIDRRKSYGATGTENVLNALQKAEKELESEDEVKKQA